MIRADLHVHTAYSPDASINPKTIVDQLYAHPFIKAAAITDHNTVKGYYKARELASVYEDILIIPGVEVSTVNGDLIVLGVAELPPKPWTVKNVIDFAKEKGALTIAAHPYRAFGLGDLARKCDVDAIEVLNGASPPNVNRLAENLAKEMHLPGVAGSDAHQASDLWMVYTEVHASLDVDEILKAIKEGFVKVASTGTSTRF
ncbi:MAG TPA: CehA/McbA family metallohydrolase [Acidobacteriota bacterium]|jgi:predicted metal-dependent phosphoesterase TrpH|nr:CehA/McbA family metallohydrolase [Acidobacteriota bacterium]